jgi:N-methylhydantoinase A/oxoprolinase/acetone carboxylase beta subunit
MRIGIDAGGTFTDFVVMRDDGHIETFKLRSNPAAPASVILEGLRRVAGLPGDADVVHGSTVATNALLERKGVVTAFVTTAGFEDLIHIGRQNRQHLYDLTPAPPQPLVTRQHCYGVHERTLFDGAVQHMPEPGELARLARQLRRAGVKSVAICFLHSYQNAQNERLAAEMLAEKLNGVYVCRSEEVSPEFREYERASTTVMNAYVGPLMQSYLSELERGWGQALSIMQSNGGLISAAEARRHAVRTVLSGPAGGVIGAVALARRSRIRRVLGFDMGGTSTDVTLADGEPSVTVEAKVDGFPVRVPMLDIHTVGAGGGSMARVDAGGLLKVGPESAGADPGPACYGKGEIPTVTDAQVVLGRIAAGQFLGGAMPIDPARALAAVERLAAALQMDATGAAAGIIRVANANMERAIRAVSIERGYDPRDFTLVAFGGAGGLHACELAAELEMTTVLVPRYAEALSALGMLLADSVRDYAAGVLGRDDLRARLAELKQRARAECGRRARLEVMADLRYAGQSYELTVPYTSFAAARRAFDAEHQRAYGYAMPDKAVEAVTLRVRARTITAKPHLPPLVPALKSSLRRRIWVEGNWRHVPVWRREELVGRVENGPGLLVDYGATTLVAPGWKVTVDKVGNALIRRSGRS